MLNIENALDLKFNKEIIINLVREIFDKKEVNYYLEEKNKRDKEIIALKYGLAPFEKDTWTYSKISEMYGISIGRVRQINSNFLRKARKILKVKNNFKFADFVIE